MFDYVCLRRSFVLMSLLGCALGQAPESGWREPSNVIRDLVVAPGKPSPSLSPQGNLLVMTTRESLPDLGVVARPHLKLAGMRIDGETWSRQLSTKTVAITVRDLSNDRVHTVPRQADHWSGPIWSADERAFALVRTVEGGGELWVADPYTAAPQGVEDPTAAGGTVDMWYLVPDMSTITSFFLRNVRTSFPSPSTWT